MFNHHDVVGSSGMVNTGAVGFEIWRSSTKKEFNLAVIGENLDMLGISYKIDIVVDNIPNANIYNIWGNFAPEYEFLNENLFIIG